MCRSPSSQENPHPMNMDTLDFSGFAVAGGHLWARNSGVYKMRASGYNKCIRMSFERGFFYVYEESAKPYFTTSQRDI
jgi:hypothetical protein